MKSPLALHLRGFFIYRGMFEGRYSAYSCVSRCIALLCFGLINSYEFLNMPSKRFFHVSHRKYLPDEMQLNSGCFNLPDPLPPNIPPHIATLLKIAKEYFPGGLSIFGIDYLMEPLRYTSYNNFGYISQAMTIDLVFELIRRARFPSLPSRYESLFACETLEEAKVFRAIKYRLYRRFHCFSQRSGSGTVDID
jgi:hypothetical protein